MITPSPVTSVGRGRCPARARELAACLSALFERDVEIVVRLNDAQRRLRDANERLWSGLSPDAFGLVYNEAATAAVGTCEIAALMREGNPGGMAASTGMLGALQQVHWAIHRAFHDYQGACEERRQLAVDVGELSQQLTEVLCAAGWSAAAARQANVHELAGAEVR